MNLLVFSSAMRPEDFESYQFSAKVKANPSNQHFYEKLIKTLSLKNTVSVISQRPFVKGMFRKTTLEEEEAVDGNTRYYYTYLRASKIYKAFFEKKKIEKTVNKAINDFKSHDFTIIVDTLKLNLLKAAKSVAKKYNVKVVGMLTDNPENLSGGNSFLKKTLKYEGQTLDGYLALTSGLVDTYNLDAPSYVFEGLVKEEQEGKKDPVFNYFYFGGSLYEKYGVKTLVDAFHQSNVKSKLVIAGSGPLEDYIEDMSHKDFRILFLSQLNKEKSFAYMKNSIANINPRPTGTKYDKESVPSKLLEYLSVGVPTISTKYPKLYGPFKDDVTWIEGNSVEDIKNTLENFDISKEEEYIKKAINAKRKVFEFYDISVQSESINHFLTEINSSINK